jgi:glycosyltransferase involved in cell wall biosynthesis
VRILIVSPYPPLRDGIGAYTVQQAMALRRQGHHVEVLSPLPSAAHHHLELRGWRGPLALAKRVSRYDRVIVHFHGDIFYPVPLRRQEWAAVTTGLMTAFFMARHLDLVIHEINYDWGRRASTRRLSRAMLRAATHILVHTATERRMLCDAFALPASAVTVIDHGSHFVRRTNAAPATARQLLGIPEDSFVFLGIGFVQPHKGFDRAIRAFDGLGDHGCRLYIVGSIRVEEAEYLAHRVELEKLAADHPGVELRFDFVSDTLFDTWLVAADVVLLPYRYIWSSGVLERARLYDRAVIASDVGGLRDQAYSRVVWFRTDEELARAMHEAAGHAHVAAATEGVEREPFLVEAGTSRDAVMSLIRQRAARHRRPQLSSDGTANPPPPSAEVLPLLRLPHLAPPLLSSRSRGREVVKRFVNTLMRWQTEPLRQQVNALRDATLEVAEQLADAGDARAAGPDAAQAGESG